MEGHMRALLHPCLHTTMGFILRLWYGLGWRAEALVMRHVEGTERRGKGGGVGGGGVIHAKSCPKSGNNMQGKDSLS